MTTWKPPWHDNMRCHLRAHAHGVASLLISARMFFSFLCIYFRPRPHRTQSTLWKAARKQWDTLLQMRVFTQVIRNIKGFAGKFACKPAYASCVNWALGPPRADPSVMWRCHVITWWLSRDMMAGGVLGLYADEAYLLYFFACCFCIKTTQLSSTGAPWILIAFLCFGAGKDLAVSKNGFGFDIPMTAGFTLGGSLVGASLAFMMEAAEFMLVTHTSSLTMAISSVFKV